MSEIKRAICIRKRRLGFHDDVRASKGLVVPVFHQDAEGWHVSTKNDFPNNGAIYVSKEYNLCEEQFAEDELFMISRIGRNDAGKETDSEFYAMGGQCEKIENSILNGLAHIVDYSYTEFRLEHITSVPFYALVKFILVRMPDGTIVGPFSVTEKGHDIDGNIQYEYSPLNNYEPKPPESYLAPIFKPACLEDLDVSVIHPEEGLPKMEIVFDWRVLPRKSDDFEWIDVITSSQLIAWANTVGIPDKQKKKRISRTDRRLLLEDLQSLPKIDTSISKARLTRLGEVIDQIDSWEDQKSTLISKLFLEKNEAVMDAVEQFIVDNRDRISEKYGLSIQTEKEDLKNESTSIASERSIEFENSVDEMERLRSEIEKLEQKKADSEAEHLTILGEIEASKVVKEEIFGVLKRANIDIDNLTKLSQSYILVEYKRDELESANKDNENKLNELNEQITQQQKYNDVVRAELKKTDEQFVAKAAEVLPFIDRFKSTRTIKEGSFDLPSKNYTSEVNDDISREEVLNSLEDYFEAAGYDISRDDLLNYLICIAQNYITIFAGYPGVGKTSFTEILSSALNIQQRTRLISVSRGWTSERDLLGYYNPLNGKFEEASTELVSRINGLSQEATDKDQSKIAPAFFVLDEANLSPIEHYWASFMPHCEIGREKTINLAGANSTKSINVPDNIRFLATVNIDSTTELFSPRLLDRAPVIYMTPPSGSIDEIDEKNISQPSVSLSYSKFLELFCNVNTEDKLNSDEERTLSDIINVLHNVDGKGGKRPIIVSYRKQRAIKLYTAKMNEFLEENDTPNKALDIAIMQFLLPCLNGHGPAFEARLQDLYEKVSNLSMTRKMLKSMMENGRDNFGNFSFFNF